jgi:hypothetical protein
MSGLMESEGERMAGAYKVKIGSNALARHLAKYFKARLQRHGGNMAAMNARVRGRLWSAMSRGNGFEEILAFAGLEVGEVGEYKERRRVRGAPRSTEQQAWQRRVQLLRFLQSTALPFLCRWK